MYVPHHVHMYTYTVNYNNNGDVWNLSKERCLLMRGM